MADFLECLNEAFKESDMELHVPFLMAIATQGFEKNTDKYSGFLADWDKYPDHSIYVGKSMNDYDGICKVEISLCKYTGYDAEGFENWEKPEYDYILEFSYDERHWGDCECKPLDKDYREDKHCCGHGCDWDAPMMKLFKISRVEIERWSGDEHDFWDFEDEYYRKDEEARKAKEEADRLAEIKRLNNVIRNANQRLKELV